MAQAVSWSNRIDSCVQALKWPAAGVAAVITPLLLWSLLKLVPRIVVSPWSLLPFAAGCILWGLLWRRWLGNSRFGKFLVTLEHESTHAMFAMLTLHRIVGFRASLGRGGEVRFLGRGNWLITVAPYFFPTAALLLFLLAYVMPFPLLPWQSFLLGVALSYHVLSTLRETHRDQTDIQQLGTTFCWLFLPAANLAVVGLLISFAHAGSEGLSAWTADVWQPVHWLWSLLPTATGSEVQVPAEAS